MNIPSKVVAGDTVLWKDCPAVDMLGNPITPSVWTLKYIFRGPTALTLTAVQLGSDWETTLSGTNSTGLSAGTYYWQAVVSNTSGDRITLGAGKLEVVADLSTLPTNAVYDGRSQVKQDLDAVQAAMRAMISGGAVAEYTVGSRHLKKMMMSELVALESKLKYEYARETKAEKIANGLGNPHKMLVRFEK